MAGARPRAEREDDHEDDRVLNEPADCGRPAVEHVVGRVAVRPRSSRRTRSRRGRRRGSPSRPAAGGERRSRDPVPQRPSNHVDRERGPENRDDRDDAPAGCARGSRAPQDRGTRRARAVGTSRGRRAAPRATPSATRARRARRDRTAHRAAARRRTARPSIATARSGPSTSPSPTAWTSPPSGPSGARERSQTRCASRNARPCPSETSSASGNARNIADGHEEQRQIPPSPIRAPGEDRERRQEGDALRACEKRQPGSDGRPPHAPLLGEDEGREREREEQRLPVHRAEEQRRREDREVENGPLRVGRPEPPSHQPVEEHERDRAGQERDRRAPRAGTGRRGVGRGLRRAAGRAGRTRASRRASRSRTPRSAGTSRCPSAPRRRSQLRARAGEGYPSGPAPDSARPRRGAPSRPRAPRARACSTRRSGAPATTLRRRRARARR